MRYLTLNEVLVLYRRIIEETGGTTGIRDFNLLESALAQPRQTFGGTELYPTLVEKATALGFSLIMNHPFVDGNKRVGHAAMEVFLVLNGYEIKAPLGRTGAGYPGYSSRKNESRAFHRVVGNPRDRKAYIVAIIAIRAPCCKGSFLHPRGDSTSPLALCRHILGQLPGQV
jgi:death-on-curing protein